MISLVDCIAMSGLTEDEVLAIAEHEQIVAGFDREIAKMKADGSYERLMKQHGM